MDSSPPQLTSIAFDIDARKQSISRDPSVFASSRKHSYASVKEDPENIQSFSTRRPQSNTSPRSSQNSLKKPSFGSDGAALSSGYLQDDEVAVVDDIFEEDLELEPIIRGDSMSHDSILSARRLRPAALDTMPQEILDLIFSFVTLDPDKDRYVDPKVDLLACLQVSRAIHSAALRVLYQHVKIPQSKAFSKFTNSLAADPYLGTLVKCLDFSHYSSIGFGRTRTVHTQTPYLTPATLKACLDSTRNLKAFLVHEHIDDELDFDVLMSLVQMPSMRALDLCSCSSQPFNEALTAVCSSLPPLNTLGQATTFLKIERLSLHECGTVRPQVFEALLPRLARLTHLDVAHTLINDKALISIPSTARISHLNLERCTQITGPTAVKFLTQHPAVVDTIVYLNLMADASRYRLLSEDDLTQLLPALPSTLRSLNIGGARVNSSHTPFLRKLATHLEELGLKGADLGLGGDVLNIFSLAPSNANHELDHPEWRSSLHYIDLTDVKSVSKMSLHYSPMTILGNETVPLEVIELGSTILADIDKSIKKQKNPEWIVRELGRRGWYIRQTDHLPSWLYTPDDGARTWKMGTRWWGMRKIPMLDQETGGMYGYFMFKRN